MDIYPKNISDAVKYFDQKTGALLSMEQLDNEPEDGSQLKPIYLIRVLWKDSSVDKDSRMLATYIFSYDDNPCHIFPKLEIQKSTKQQILAQNQAYESAVVDELLMNPDRLYEFVVEPFSVVGNTDLNMLDNQIPLRIKDTVFLDLIDE